MRRRTEPIEVEIGGHVHRGERIVIGEHDLRQEVRYEELRHRDPNDYVPGDETFMRAIAADGRSAAPRRRHELFIQRPP